MIKVLIIEDNLEKLRMINSFLNDVCNIKENFISVADNIKSGREELIQNQFDLLLLDLVLPVNNTDEASPEAGSNFLDEIHYNPNINIPIHIIGLTEFDEIFKKYRENFDDKLWGLINFKLQENDWKDKLKSKIFYLQSFKNKYVEILENRNKYDIAIITALNLEFEQLIKTTNWHKIDRENDPIVYYATNINTKNNNNKKIIACSINQMGMQASATVASKVISIFSPDKIFITGICAGIKESGVNIGDIIVANQCWDYESGKVTEDSSGNLLFKPDIHCIPTDQTVISKLTDFSNVKNYLSNIYNDYEGDKPNTQLKVLYGPIGSGPYILSSKQYLKTLLLSERKLLGVDTEGYGLFKAAQFHTGTVSVFIKAVSDLGDENKNDYFQKFAAYVSAKFVIEFIYNTF
jgi:nucleoside phosphorylase/CheY-like chemotaxis protein